MNQPSTRPASSIFGAFFAVLLVAGTLFLAGCSNAPDNTVKAKADHALDLFVKAKFTKLTPSDFTLKSTKLLPDDSWEFNYESAPRADLPRFQLKLTITADGRELWRGYKENDPSKPPVGADALKHKR